MIHSVLDDVPSGFGLAEGPAFMETDTLLDQALALAFAPSRRQTQGLP